MYHTHTWGGRNKEQLEYLALAASERLILEDNKPLRLLNIGPGGVPERFAELYSSPPSRNKIAKIKESILRKYFAGNLHTFEPVEFVDAILAQDRFKETPIEYTAIDISQKVLDAVTRSFTKKQHPQVTVNTVCHDMQAPLPQALIETQFDVVFAGYFFTHLSRKQAAYESIANLTAPSGLFSITRSSESKGMTWFLRLISGKLNQDYSKELEAQMLDPNSDYSNVIDIHGRKKFEIITGKFPIYQKM